MNQGARDENELRWRAEVLHLLKAILEELQSVDGRLYTSKTCVRRAPRLLTASLDTDETPDVPWALGL